MLVFLNLILYVLAAVLPTSCAGLILTPEVDIFINNLLVQYGVAGGVGVAVVHKATDGEWVTETKGYGYATLNGSVITEDTLFAIGSNSKTFTAAATGLLISNTSLSSPLNWTSRFSEIFPMWGLEDNIAQRFTTIKDAMSHRTGMPRHDSSFGFSDDALSIMDKVKHQRPSAEFRDVFQYNNNMYSILSYLPIYLLPDKPPFARYVKEHIFDPLNLKSTTYSYDLANATDRLAEGLSREVDDQANDYLDRGIPHALPFWSTHGGEDGNIMAGAGGIISSPADMAIWLKCLLLDGAHPGTGETVIPADVVETIASGVTILNQLAVFPELSPTVYGGGQLAGTYRGHEFVLHDGSVPGFFSQVARLPFDDIGIAVLSNDDYIGQLLTTVILYRLYDSALGLEPIDWDRRLRLPIEQALEEPPFTRPSNSTPPSVSVETLAGVYTNAGYQTVEFCIISSPEPPRDITESCQDLIKEVPTILPGIVEANVTTLVARWDAVYAPYLRLQHFDGNVFSLNQLNSITTNNATEPYWVYPGTQIYEGVVAEFSDEGGEAGFGVRGVWGAGAGVPSPEGSTVRERSEVWFRKVQV